MNDIESISLDIANFWTSTEFFKEINSNCGTLVAFDWYDGSLVEINTNIDLHDLEVENFEFDSLINFLKENDFNFILGLRNVKFKNNPSESWTNELKKHLTENNSEYEEYIIQAWPTSIPQFDVPENLFILRYSFSPDNKVDELAGNDALFKDWIIKTDWEDNFSQTNTEEKDRVIVLVNDVENLVLHKGYIK
tara:strand:- start:594 stop:1172 length:579 start_codon:yes stop_codon:yes gene_type:complete